MEREQTTLRLSPELKKEILQVAEQMGFSFNSAVIYLLEKALGLE